MSKDDEKEKRCVLKVINILSFENIIPFSFLPHACITVLKKENRLQGRATITNTLRTH